MSEHDDDRERPKKSWREIDRGRDRSQHVTGGRTDSPRGRERSGQSRAALERAFKDGLVKKLVAEKEKGKAPETTSARPAILKKIRVSESRAEVNAAIDELLASSGFPDDWDVLIRALDHNRDQVVLTALRQIEELLARESPPRRAVLVQRLAGLADGSLDDDVRELAEKLRAGLS